MRLTNVFRFELDSNFCGQNRLFSQCNTFEQINAITIIYYFKVIRIIFADRIENNRILIWYKRIKRNSGIVEKKNNRMDRKIDAGKMRGKFVGSNEKASDFVCDPCIGRKRKSKAWWTLWEVGALIRLDQREKIERQLPSDLQPIWLEGRSLIVVSASSSCLLLSHFESMFNQYTFHTTTYQFRDLSRDLSKDSNCKERRKLLKVVPYYSFFIEISFVPLPFSFKVK